MAERKRQQNQVGGRPYRHVVRLTEAEELELSVAASRDDRTVSRFVVESALARVRGVDVSDVQQTIAALFAVQHQLAKVGNNVNQIARHANATGGEILREELAQELAELRGSVRRVNEVLEQVSLESRRA